MTEQNRHFKREQLGSLDSDADAGGGSDLDTLVRPTGNGLELLPDPWEHAGLIPPRRLGALLSESRSRQGATLADVAEASNGRFSFATLASVERGTTALTEKELSKVAELYGVQADSLIPTRSRLVVDLEEGRMWVAQTRHKARLDGRSTTHDVLARYLSMVYCMREIDPGTKITLRVEDLDVLGAALSTGVDRVAADLEALMDDPDGTVSWRARLLRRSVLIPAAGLLVAFSGIGALILTQASDPTPAGASEPATATAGGTGDVAPGPDDVRIGTAVVQERNADGTPGPITER